MNKPAYYLVYIMLMYSSCFFANNYAGLWEQHNKDGEKGALIQIEKLSSGAISGTIIYLYQYPQNIVCSQCKGVLHNKPIVGMQILYDFSFKNGDYINGKVLDVKTGKIYHAKLSYNKKDDTLLLRASIDAAGYIGETQVWRRNKDKIQ